VTVTERISLWLRQVGRPHCDDCLVNELKLTRRQQANRATNALAATRNFIRDKGVCSLCGRRKMVIEAI
jgi:hypothetical protein